MPDRSISATLTGSIVAWVIGFLLIAVGLFSSAETAPIGLWISGVGGILSMRHFLVAMVYREKNAFQLGQDYAEMRLQRAEVVRIMPAQQRS